MERPREQVGGVTGVETQLGLQNGAPVLARHYMEVLRKKVLAFKLLFIR